MDNPEDTPPAFIYALVDPREPEHVRYVGWTVNPRYRLRVHIKDARGGEKTYRNHWIRKLLREGVEPKIGILEKGPEDYREAERRWIFVARALGHRLTNQTDGGDGAPGYRHTPEVIERLRAVIALKRSVVGEGTYSNTSVCVALSHG